MDVLDNPLDSYHLNFADNTLTICIFYSIKCINDSVY